MHRVLVLGCVVFLLSAGPVSCGASPGEREQAARDVGVGRPLKGLEFVPLKELAERGPVLAPRGDARVPKLFVELFADEEIARIYPWCRFTVEEGHPVWTWHTWNNSGVYETDGEALRKRLVARLAKQGFEPLPGTPDERPNSHRSGERPMRYRRVEPGRKTTVAFGDLFGWTGGRRPAVGIDLVLEVRGTERVESPTVGDVIAAFPDLVPPKAGSVQIPPDVLTALYELPAESVTLEGPGTTWYSFEVVTPTTAYEKAGVEAVLGGKAKEHEFVPETPWPGKRGPREIVHLRKRGSKATSNCRIRVHENGENGRMISLFVQR